MRDVEESGIRTILNPLRKPAHIHLAIRRLNLKRLFDLNPPTDVLSKQRTNERPCITSQCVASDIIRDREDDKRM